MAIKPSEPQAVRIRFSDVRSRILFALAKHSVMNPGSITLDQIVAQERLEFAPGWVVQAADQLYSDGYITMSRSGRNPLTWRVAIRPKGIEQAELLGDIIQGVEQAAGSIPAADRLVELDHNSEAYADTLAAIEKVRDEVKASNEYAADDPEDRDQQISELNAGLEILKAVRVRLSVATNLILPPLMHLAQKFSDNLIGELAKQAAHFLRTLIGL